MISRILISILSIHSAFPCIKTVHAFASSFSTKIATPPTPSSSILRPSFRRWSGVTSVIGGDHAPRRIVFSLSNSKEGVDNEDDKDAEKSVKDKIFWAKQRALAAEMTANSNAGLKREQMEKFAKRRMALVSDTFYFSILISSLLWIISSNPFVTISYIFGALLGTAYSYGLGKYVESIGGSIDDPEMGAEGAGLGQARFAFLILLFVFVGKFRDQGLLEIPSILGFFTYQLASLWQGLREIDD